MKVFTDDKVVSISFGKIIQPRTILSKMMSPGPTIAFSKLCFGIHLSKSITFLYKFHNLQYIVYQEMMTISNIEIFRKRKEEIERGILRKKITLLWREGLFSFIVRILVEMDAEQGRSFD